MKFRSKKCSLGAALFLAGNNFLFANPTGMTVVSGSAIPQQNGSQLNVIISQAAFLNWSSFDIQPGETTTFVQPSASSVAINLIGGANPSQIFGNLNANGTVILANASGFYFGPNSMIKVGGSFIATTAPLTPDFGAGSAWQFTGMPPLKSIVNYGQIQVGNGKSLFLIAEQIENHGELAAPGGDVGLYASESVLVSDRPDGRGLSATVQIPSGSINNFGQITADAGTIALQAQVVNQDGIIQADSVQNQNGVIELVASDSLKLGADSRILARGDDAASGSSGGSVTLKSDNTFSDTGGSKIVTTGGANGGNGGSVEISARDVQSLKSSLNARAQAGWTAGKLLLDPDYIILDLSGSGSAGSGAVLAGDNPGSTLDLNVNSAFANLAVSQIILQAAYDITLAGGTSWNLSGTIGANYGGVTSGQLTLEAGRNIIFGAGSKITDANDWSVTLEAGYNFANQAVQSGIGNIYLNGGSGLSQSSTIQLFAGSINLWAGQSILLAAQNNHAKSIVSGSVFTTGGGGIFAYALAGDIDAGTSNGGTSSTTQTSDYNFTDSGSTPNPVLGGISTAGGGNVTLIAGNNIDSTPVVQSGQWPGASGAYGAGNVTVIAGNQINGNYTLANGVGTMLAGVQVQSGQAGVLQNPNANPTAYASTLKELETAVTQTQNLKGNIGGIEYAGQSPSSVTLSLIEGSWNAWAANNIYLKEVNNPNGTFNSAQSYLYNYAPDAAANLWAGNAIELAGGMVGGTLARVSRGNQNIIYAPSLSLNAGAGGIQIDKSIILAPSSEGSLELITRDGGNLSGWVTAGSTVLIGITMSDSDSTDYRKFATGHAATPLHLNDPNPVTLDVSGSIESFGLTVPTFAQINVVGDTYNFGFLGQNLLPSQTTSIDVGQTAKANMEHLGLLDPNTDGSLTVGGDITYRGDLTSIPSTGQLAEPLPAFLFDLALSGDSEVASKLRYDATTGKLTFIGVMSSAELAFLLNPTKVVLDANGQPVLNPVLDANGNPVLDSNGNPETVPATQPVTLDPAQKAEIQQLSAASQSATLGDQGLAIAGPGNFNITAHSLDLGISGGVSVVAPDSALAAISPYGANLNVTTGGNLELTSTKIANESLLGGINLDIGGTLDVGGQFTTFGDPSSPKGIFTTSGGNVSITANGDVNVDGSRIAAYNGGNINIKSLVGDVNAGAGGEGYVTLNALEIDPATGQLTGIPATIPGSGILATAVFGSDALLGNITVNAPNGSINASLGGIIQIAFNDADTRNNFVELTAGHDINASGSGIIGSNIKLQAGGDINGLVIGSQSVNINSAQSVDVTVVSGGDVNISASGEIAGTVIGGGSVNASGDSITASLISESVSASGDTSGATEGVPQSNVAKNNAETADNASTVASKTDDQDDDETRKNGKDIALVQKTSRVTVILPAKQQSKAQNLEPGT